MKIKILSALFLGAFASQAADKFTLEDFDYSITGTSVVSGSDYITAFWGTYTGGVFTPLSGVNNGYFALSGDDSLANFSATNNNNAIAGSQLFLGIFDAPTGTAFASIGEETAYVVLTDSSWAVPALSNAPGTISFEFSAQTQAVVGSYNFNGGNNALELVSSAIPEPSSFAALAGLSILGAVATRRRRSA